MAIVESSRRSVDDSQPIPTSDLESAKEATTSSVWRLHVRYVLLAVALNFVVAAVVVVYDVFNDQENTRVFLTDTAHHAAHLARVLNSRSTDSDRRVIDEASELTACEMALLSKQGHVFYGTNSRLGYQVRAQGWPDQTTPLHDSRLLIDERLAELSGLWWVGEYNDEYRLLIIVPRNPEDEGRLQYMTFAAGITGAGVLLTLIIMLIASNWMLRRPLERLIEALTSALVRDVKRRKEAEERANEARLEAERHLRFRDNLIDASKRVALVATNEDGVIELVNSAAVRILGFAEEELVGVMTLEQLLSALEPKGEQSAEESLQPFLHISEDERRIVDTRGGEHIVKLSTSTIHESDGRSAGTLMTFTDITEQRRIEAELNSKQMQLIQSSRMATLGEMAAGVAHEINQPLNNIGLLSARVTRRLKKKRDVGPREVEFLEEKLTSIQEQVKRAAKIIDHLRVFGRAEPTPLSKIDVEAAIQGCLELLGEQLSLHDVRLKIDIPDELPRVLGDVSRLEQVLINLLVNARYALDEYAEELRRRGDAEEYNKNIVIRVNTGDLNDGSPALFIEVEDNGPGMPEEVADRVFEPFFTTKEVGKGTGLGLSISYGIVREFGGTFSLRTEPGLGTKFTIGLKQAGTEGGH